ncbi:MAG: hypothetical protein SYC29_10340 [Planctomycetota bacterium]|nr:hypothetical protein [Planctomycetota bacterium]
MSDRDEPNPEARDQADAVTPTGEDAAPQAGSTPRGQPPPAGDADASPEDVIDAMADSMADIEAEADDGSDDEINRLISDIDALTRAEGLTGGDEAAETATEPADGHAGPMSSAAAPDEPQPDASASDEKAPPAPELAETTPTPAARASSSASSKPEDREIAAGNAADHAGEAVDEPGHEPSHAALGEAAETPLTGTAQAAASADTTPRGDESAPIDSQEGTGGDSTLAEIDEALAEDVEELLEGSYEVVSRVLDDVFDEHAIAVPDGEPDPEATPESPVADETAERAEEEVVAAEPIADADAALQALTDAASFESVEEVVGIEAESTPDEAQRGRAGELSPESPAASPEESSPDRGPARAAAPTEDAPGQASAAAPPTAPAESAPEPSAESMTEAAGGAASAPPAVDGASSDQPAEQAAGAADVGTPKESASEMLPSREPARRSHETPAALEPSTEPPEPSPAADAREVNEPPADPVHDDAGSSVDVDDEPIGVGLAAHLQSVVTLAGRAVLPVLAALSLPLRFVPPPLRPLVDWIALSLVFWVPIVWILVLFVMGR